MTVATTKLTVFNSAIRHLGVQSITDTADTTSLAATVFNSIWDDDSFITDVLGQGQWKWATRTMEVGYDPDMQVSFGNGYIFTKPDDLIAVTGVWVDPQLTQPLLGYRDAGGFWTAYVQTMYVAYVSSDPDYGANLLTWPNWFVRFVEAYLAWRGAYRITQSRDDEARMQKLQKKLGMEAKSMNARQGATVLPLKGSWSTARTGGWGSNGPGWL